MNFKNIQFRGKCETQSYSSIRYRIIVEWLVAIFQDWHKAQIKKQDLREGLNTLVLWNKFLGQYSATTLYRRAIAPLPMYENVSRREFWLDNIRSKKFNSKRFTRRRNIGGNSGSNTNFSPITVVIDQWEGNTVSYLFFHHGACPLQNEIL